MCADKTDIANSVNREGGLLFDRALLPQARPDMLDPAHWQAQTEQSRGGRGAVWMLSGPFGAGVLRHYRRGGMAARVSRDTYLWRGAEQTRSFAEFRLLLRMRELGLPVPRPILAGYQRVAPLRYRADLLMSRIENSHSLAERLGQAQIEGLSVESLGLDSLGHTLARFHCAGIDHADLNAHNLLQDTSGSWWVIDFDRGKIRQPQRHWIKQRLLRLRRSINKVLAANHKRAEACWRSLRAAHDCAAPEYQWRGPADEQP